MSIDYSSLPLHKGTPRKTLARRQQREEDKVKREVRAKCVERDGFCRMSAASEQFNDVKPLHYCCVGADSEWAHFGEKKRAKTRGMAPEDRHLTTHSLMLCDKLHDAYDDGLLLVTALTRKGCDGRLKFKWRMV